LLQDFVTNFNEEQKDKIFLEILSNGKASLDFAKKTSANWRRPTHAASKKPILVYMWHMPSNANGSREQVLWKNKVHNNSWEICCACARFPLKLEDFPEEITRCLWLLYYIFECLSYNNSSSKH
jgi:hypothetical protein